MSDGGSIRNAEKITSQAVLLELPLKNQDAATPSEPLVREPLVLLAQAPAPRSVSKGRPTDDVLAAYTPAEVAGWYRRLALFTRTRKPNSLAAQMLLHWLDGGGKPLTFDAAHVKNLKYVREYLLDEVRPVFLTEKKLKDGKWGGVLPRIKGLPPHPPWDGKSKFQMSYEGPSVEVPLSLQAKAKLGFADPEELDILASLHTFGLRTNVVANAVPIPPSHDKYTVTFESWETKAFDRYDWDPQKHLTFPNPDFGNPSKLLTPVAPDEEEVRVYHLNAKRVEGAKLASPYDASSTPWTVTDTEITGPGTVDASRKL
jgi:hypothetical protein